MPQGPQVPAMGSSLEQQQARTRAINQASMDQADRYIAAQQQRGRELQQEIQVEQQRRAREEQARQQYKLANQQLYESTYQTLQGMLEGRRQWDLKRAVFLTENAFMNGGLDYAQFSTDIHELTQICRGLAADSARPDLAARFMALHETTRGFFVSDSYYMSSGFIKAGALKNRSYLDTLTRRETMACRVFDLAQSYAWRYGHDAFTAKCAALGLRYYPQSVQGRMLAHDAALMALMVAVKANGQPTEGQARMNPKLLPLMEEVERRARAVDELGHEEMPADQYARWLKQVEQEQNRMAGQQAASRFEQTAKK